VPVGYGKPLLTAGAVYTTRWTNITTDRPNQIPSPVLQDICGRLLTQVTTSLPNIAHSSSITQLPSTSREWGV